MDDAIRTIAELPFYVHGRHPKDALIGQCRGDSTRMFSTQEFFDQVRDQSLGLSTLGVEAGDRVAILSDSRPEWMIADLAILTAGGVTVPIYPTLPPSQVRYILADSNASVIVAANEEQAAKVRAVWDDLPSLRTLVVMDPPAGETSGDGGTGRVTLSLEELAVRGHQYLITGDGVGLRYKETALAIEPDQLATIIYTSGTTGEPKGVMLTHRNVASNMVDSAGVVVLNEEDITLSFLPLSHAFERLVNYLNLWRGVTVTFAESLDTIAPNMQLVRPTVMTGVPRVYEKLHARIFEAVESAPAIRKKLFHWAVGVGTARARAQLAGQSVPLGAALQYPLADRLVLSKIRARLGGRIRILVSGAAPLTVPVAEFLFAIGAPVLEGYGLTETSPTVSVNPLEKPKLGTVGPAIPNVEIRIAEDGEILVRGPNVMQGYYHKQEATDEVIREGWFHTGDLGSLDGDGYLTITGRKKELIVTAGGKNISPAPIEATLKRSPLVAEAVLIGDRRPYCTALLIPDFPALAARTPGDDASREALVERPDVVRLFDAIVEDANAELAPHEQVKRFALLPAEFAIATGELTPTMKVKRNVVCDRWADTIERLYAG
ncbi:MAG: long-chain fatty acid--CoA ligase [Acidobacteria bacterium]|nr:long-chain fatty acid--CoA ligase [Acidobacteriota bacterium]MYJ03273.1 long-chain fatty acid--CoA ligase [Acidobacteriota bacterium]